MQFCINVNRNDQNTLRERENISDMMNVHLEDTIMTQLYEEIIIQVKKMYIFFWKP